MLTQHTHLSICCVQGFAGQRGETHPLEPRVRLGVQGRAGRFYKPGAVPVPGGHYSLNRYDRVSRWVMTASAFHGRGN